MITKVEQLTDESIIIICNDEKTARQCIKRNPSCAVQHGDDEKVALVYNINQINLINCIKRK